MSTVPEILYVNPDDLTLSTREVAQKLGVHINVVIRWIKDGTLPFTKVNQNYRIPLSSLAAAIELEPPAKNAAPLTGYVSANQGVTILIQEVQRLREEVAVLSDLIRQRPVRRKSVTAGQRERILNRDGWRCRYTGVRLTENTAHVDHLVPVSRGGKNYDINLVACTRKANMSKGDLLVHEAGMHLLHCPLGDEDLNRMQQQLASGEQTLGIKPSHITTAHRQPVQRRPKRTPVV